LAGEVSIAAERASTQRVLSLLGMIFLVRALMSALLPLSFDEAYYWRWSQHLAAGYWDHPPLIAYIIRLGTLVFGDSEFGVRFVPLLLSFAATWAIWRAAAIALKSEFAGAVAALLYNLTLMVGVQALVATPDAPSMAASAFFLLALVKVAVTDKGAWWIVAGIAGGFALLSKYTALFLGAGALVWLIVAEDRRVWLGSFWPYLGAVIALMMFAPVLMWNAGHDWISFERQFGRVNDGSLTLRYLGEFLGAQIGLATPFIFFLGVLGIAGTVRSKQMRSSNAALFVALMIPAVLYFLWHSLFARVQGNWPSFVYPMFVICAAMAMRWTAPGWRGRALRFSQIAALPTALILTMLTYAHALSPLIPLDGTRDPVSRLLAVGYAPLANEIDALRVANGAEVILTTGYAQTSWLSFYLPSRPMVIQINERDRWLAEPTPQDESFEGPLLYVTEGGRNLSALLAERFADVELIDRLERRRRGSQIEEIAVYRVQNPIGPVLD
jgi:4-amino-4-deoxy-L-arabinose transferase-like glycosyltransferase